MDDLSSSLLSATVAVAVIHTLLGPDHYLPFIVLARARGWSRSRAAAVTAVCGGAHVLSSLVLAGIGVLFGFAVGAVERWQTTRGGIAAWLLVGFGVAYGVWGLRTGLRRRRGWEPHTHDDHVHVHRRGDVPHGHAAPSPGSRFTFWTLLTVFVLGPCEPLIPIVMLPVSRGRWGLALVVALLFATITIVAMVVATLLGLAGLRPVRLSFLERWSHGLAGGVIAASGLAILLLGW